MEITQQPQLPRNTRPIVCIGGGDIMYDAQLPAYKKTGFPVAGVYDPDQDHAKVGGPGRSWTPLTEKDAP
jgi:hypothetical protein